MSCRSWWAEVPGCAPWFRTQRAGPSMPAASCTLNIPKTNVPPVSSVTTAAMSALALHQQIARALEQPAPLGNGVADQPGKPPAPPPLRRGRPRE